MRTARGPQPEPIHIKVNDRGSKKGQHLAEDQTAHNRDTQRPPQLRAFAQADRQANVKHAFGLFNEKKVAGKHILLVDDVMTTGATLCETARCMLFAKPASISAAVLAVADPAHRHFTRV